MQLRRLIHGLAPVVLCAAMIGLGGHLLSMVSAAHARSPVKSAQTGEAGRQTGLPVPRFVSLKSSRARMRIGPSTDYKTAFIYKARGLPLEIIEEYGNWRQVRDSDGVTGWMHRSLLSGRRTAIVGPWIKDPVALRSQPAATGSIYVRLTGRVRLGVRHCDGAWCSVDVKGHHLTGFVRQSALWGIYPGETVG